MSPITYGRRSTSFKYTLYYLLIQQQKKIRTLILQILKEISLREKVFSNVLKTSQYAINIILLTEIIK